MPLPRAWMARLLLCLLAVGLTPRSHARPASAMAWSEPLQLSDPSTSLMAAAPGLAVDGDGRVHVLWYSVLNSPAESPTEEDRGLTDAFIYRVRAGGVWSAPEPIYMQDRPSYVDTSSPLTSNAAVSNTAFVLQAALTNAPDGRLHIAFGDSQTQRYLGLPWHEVVRLALLLPPFALGPGTSSAIAGSADGTLHVALTGIPRGVDAAMQEGQATCADCIDVLYRRSISGGVTWARPENLARIEGEDANPQIVADERGQVHLLWEHLALEQSGGQPYLLYRRSPDGGQHWLEPVRFESASEGLLQGRLGVGRDGRLLMVYGGTRTGTMFYQSSDDGGVTWSALGLVPGVLSPGLTSTAKSRFSLAADGAGHMHLLMAGALPADSSSGLRLLHLSWDGQSWSAPRFVASEGPAPISPQLAVERGNRIHAVWSTTEIDADRAERQMIWYSAIPVEAPERAPLPTFTPVIVLPTAVPTAPPQPTPTLLPSRIRRQATVDGPPRWEGESLPVLVAALFPALLLVGAVVWWATRRGRDV